MRTILCKFGGTSLATAENIKKVVDIIKADSNRRIVVVSAPGRRTKDDTKVTDMLIAVGKRYSELEEAFGKKLDIVGDISRLGEYYMAQLVADILGYEFVDIQKTGIVSLDKDGNVDLETSAKNFLPYKNKNIVVPGFYGVLPDGRAKTFERGGSDITGAIVANIADADVYENWTDVNGVFSTDPNKNTCSVCLTELSYSQALSMCSEGASVLHPSTMKYIQDKKIPLVIKNTFDPSHAGTIISATCCKKKLRA